MNILLWHVHGSWTNAFVQGSHRYLLPVVPDRGPDGRGRARTWDWPDSTVERAPADLADEAIDVVVLQRPEEEPLARRWLGGRLPGRDVPLVYLEHNAPQGRISEMRHPMADRDDVTVVHVTHFNSLFWDVGSTRSRVIEHGIVDPGYRYTGELDVAAVVVNEPERRDRVTGTDLLPILSRATPIDLFGMQVSGVDSERALGGGTTYDDFPQHCLHRELARRRTYLHPIRWTSLGLSLLEAMHLGMPIVALDTTETSEVVPKEVGVVSNRLEVLAGALRHFKHEPEAAHLAGLCARDVALDRFGLDRFLDDWDRLLEEVG